MYPVESPFCTNKEGYNDLVARIDLSSYRRIPWENNMPLFLISFFDPKDGRALEICPRNLLNLVVEKIKSQLNCESLAGLEFEVRSFNSYIGRGS